MDHVKTKKFDLDAEKTSSVEEVMIMPVDGAFDMILLDEHEHAMVFCLHNPKHLNTFLGLVEHALTKCNADYHKKLRYDVVPVIDLDTLNKKHLLN